MRMRAASGRDPGARSEPGTPTQWDQVSDLDFSTLRPR